MWKKSKDEKELVKNFEDKILSFYGNDLKSKKRKDKLAEVFKKYKNNFLVDMYRGAINMQKNRFNFYTKRSA